MLLLLRRRVLPLELVLLRELGLLHGLSRLLALSFAPLGGRAATLLFLLLFFFSRLPFDTLLVASSAQVLTILYQCLDEWRHSSGSRVDNAPLLVLGYLSGLAVAWISLELSLQTETLQENLLILSRFLRVCVLLLQESVGEVHFQLICLLLHLLS